MISKAHFKAHVKLRTPENGGRHSDLDLAHYRPNLSFEADDRWYYGAHPTLEDGSLPPTSDVWLSPGDKFDAYFWIRSAAPEILPRLKVGSRFRVMEGGRAVADGEVSEII
jgi:translation elongation factor EF-Tu-like GTPase